MSFTTGMAEDSYYIVVSHPTFKDTFFPNNKADEFYFRFTRRVRLTGLWKVALCEITFVNVSSKLKNDETAAIYYVDFSTCHSILVDCIQGTTLRAFQRTEDEDKHIVFDHLMYVNIDSDTLDTCELTVKPVIVEKKLLEFDLKDNSDLILTLHFKRFSRGSR